MHAWETKNRVYFALDYCSGGDLGNLLLKKKTFIEEQYILNYIIYILILLYICIFNLYRARFFAA